MIISEFYTRDDFYFLGTCGWVVGRFYLFLVPTFSDKVDCLLIDS